MGLDSIKPKSSIDLSPSSAVPTNQSQSPVPSILPSFPPTASATTNLKDREFQSGTQTTDDLALQLAAKEKEIEENIKKIKEHKAKMGLIEGGLYAKSDVLGLVDSARDLTVSGMEQLGSILPPDLLSDPTVAGRIKNTYATMELSQAIQSALDSGLTGLAQIYKGKLLEECFKFLNEIKANYKEKNEPLPNSIKEWEIKLNKEKIALDKIYLKLGLAGGKKIISILNDLSSAGSPIKEGLSNTLAVATPAIGLILSTSSFRHTEHEVDMYNKWVQDFQAWQQRTKLGGKITALSTDETPPTIPSVLKKIDEISLPRKRFKLEFNQLVKKSRNLDEIKSVLKQCEIYLEPSIKTKEEFIIRLSNEDGYKKQILAQYSAYKQKLGKLNAILASSENLVVKREATVEKKVLQLLPDFEALKPKLYKANFSRYKSLFPELSEFIAQATSNDPSLKKNLKKFGIKLPENIWTKEQIIEHLQIIQSTSYKKWFSIQPKNDLLKTYIDHQETLEITTKNALIGMTNKKHELDSKFNSFNLAESRVSYGLLVVTLGVTAVLSILALAAIPPFLGSPLILSLLSTASTVSGFGFMGLGYYMSYRYKNSTLGIDTYFLNSSYSFNELLRGLQSYKHLSVQKKLKETQLIVSKLQTIHNQNDDALYVQSLALALENYKKAKAEFEESEKKLQELQKKVDKISESLTKKAWQDFASYGGLKVEENENLFDTLRALESALRNSDVSLFDPETKKFLEMQLGMDLSAVQKEMDESPSALKDAIQNIFTIDESNMARFIDLQRKRSEAGII